MHASVQQQSALCISFLPSNKKPQRRLAQLNKFAFNISDGCNLSFGCSAAFNTAGLIFAEHAISHIMMLLLLLARRAVQID